MDEIIEGSAAHINEMRSSLENRNPTPTPNLYWVSQYELVSIN
jgi:hypothetical protein